MTLRTGLAAAALWAAVGCGDRGAPPSPVPAVAGGTRGARSARADDRATVPGPRGDRHARAAAGRARPIHEVQGTIVRSERGLLAVRSQDGRETTLRIGPRTAVTVPSSSAPGRRTPLAPGVEVRASWRSGEGNPPTALSVQVRDAAQQDPWTDRG